jgi:hypothetical protein
MARRVYSLPLSEREWEERASSYHLLVRDRNVEDLVGKYKKAKSIKPLSHGGSRHNGIKLDLDLVLLEPK